jgi:hypothetical protein
MKGKMIRFVLGMILILSLWLSMAFPVAAKSAKTPNVLGYINGSSNIGLDTKHPILSMGGKISLLADGTITGHWTMSFFDGFDEGLKGLDPALAGTRWTCDEFEGLYFIDADMGWFYGWFTLNNNKKSEYTGPLPIMIAIRDMGKQNVSNDVVYLGLNAPPTIIEHGNFQVWVSDEILSQ